MAKNKIITCLNCEDVDMKVIKCGIDLTIDQCPNCGGIWFDRGELNDLITLGEYYLNNVDITFKAKIDKNRIRECPRCNIVLKPVKPPKWKDITIDRCSECKGIWLDRGELTNLIKEMK